MEFQNILITTGLVWLLSALVVKPLAGHLLQRQLAQPEHAPLSGAELSEEQTKALQSVATRCYILADVLVLGMVGLIGGLLGYTFIGIAWKAREWPGMIAFVIGSFVGFAVGPGVVA